MKNLKDFFSIYQESEPEEQAEIKLLKSLLVRAIRDARGNRTDIRASNRRDAIAWFYATSSEPFSYKWVCRYLDYCPRNLLKRIKL